MVYIRASVPGMKSFSTCKKGGTWLEEKGALSQGINTIGLRLKNRKLCSNNHTHNK